MKIFFLALILIGAGGFQALLTFRAFRVMKAVAVLAIIGGCVLGTYDVTLKLLQQTSPITVSWDWLQIFTLSLTLDSISSFFLIPVFIVSAVSAVYSFQYLHDSNRSLAIGGNYFFYAILVLSMVLVLCAGNFITFALAWELMSVSSFFLVIYNAHKKTTREAGYIYFVFTQAGALFIFAGFGYFYAQTGHFNFDGLAALPETTKFIGFLLILIGCGSKAGIIPLHIWLPYAHPAAPSHVSAVMSGVMIKMGIYGIVRFYLLLAPSSALFAHLIIILGIVTGLLGVIYAIGKQDLKTILAYSSVENIGIILLGLGVGMLGVATDNTIMAAFGFGGGLLHVFNHSIFKSLLFMGAGTVLHQTKISNCSQLGGLMKKMPVTARAFLVGSVSISGLPPFNGFISEFLIYYGAIHGLSLHGISFILSVLVILSLAVIGALAIAAFTKVVGIGFLGEPRTNKAANASEAGKLMTLPLCFLALFCFVIGIWPVYFVQATYQASRVVPLLTNYDAQLFLPIMANITKVAALFLILLIIVSLLRRVLYRGKEVTFSNTWSCGFTQPTSRMQYTGISFGDTIIDFFRPFIRVKKHFLPVNTIFPQKTTYSYCIEDFSEVSLNTLFVRPILFLFGKLRWIQHGYIQLYIAYIVLAIVIMLILF